MESLLYVIFYCALHWLPNDLPNYQFDTLVSDFFSKRITIKGIDIGGNQKNLNARGRAITSQIRFPQAFQRWFDTVMDYHSPPEGSEEEPKWTDPKDLDQFWSSFLVTEADSMANNDRKQHPALSRSRDWSKKSTSTSWLTVSNAFIQKVQVARKGLEAQFDLLRESPSPRHPTGGDALANTEAGPSSTTETRQRGAVLSRAGKKGKGRARKTSSPVSSKRDRPGSPGDPAQELLKRRHTMVTRSRGRQQEPGTTVGTSSAPRHRRVHSSSAPASYSKRQNATAR